MRKILLLGVLLAVGCGPPAPVNVFGSSGKKYSAPNLCQAILSCRAGGESACYYNTASFTDPNNGNTVYTEVCRKAKGK